MASPVVESSFDVAYWFVDRALNDGEYLQPQKLHRLLYLAQAYYAAACRGRMLMPALFLADPMGPVEPNVFRACAIQRPAIEARPMPETIGHFLDSIWRGFGHHSADYLSRLVCGHPPYVDASAEGARSIISLKAMADFYGRKPDDGEPEAQGAPPVSQVLRPRVMRSQDGKPVSVQRWAPPVKNSGK